MMKADLILTQALGDALDKLEEQKKFMRWLARLVTREDGEGAECEIICRRLYKMGYVEKHDTKDGKYWRMRMMDDDLILRRDAIKALGEFPYNWNNTPEELQEISDFMYHFNTLGKVPAVDAVPVVRCKDCRWGEWSKNCRGEDMVICNNTESPVSETYRLVEPDWYCADGERREADDTP